MLSDRFETLIAAVSSSRIERKQIISHAIKCLRLSDLIDYSLSPLRIIFDCTEHFLIYVTEKILKHATLGFD